MEYFEKPDPEIQKIINVSLRYLSVRPRSIDEVRQYLDKKNFQQDIIEKAIEQLKQNSYLNDRTFARLFVENRIRNKAKSKFALRYELKKKGINSNIIDDMVENLDDNELAFLAVCGKVRLWSNLDPEVFKKKVINYLHYRGFSYSVCMNAWSRVSTSDSDQEKLDF